MADGGGLLPGVCRVWGRFLSLLKTFASCKVQAEPSLPFLEQPERERWWIVVVGFVFFFAQPFHTNVFNYPEKASQRQRGKALGYSGCIQFLPCSTDIPAGAVSVPGSLLSLTRPPALTARMHRCTKRSWSISDRTPCSKNTSSQMC